MEVKKLIICIALFLLLLCAANCKFQNNQSNNDNEPLWIESTYPENGTTGVAMQSNMVVQITFSKPMNQQATERALIIYPGETYEVYWESGGTLMCINHLSLPPNTHYKITIGTEAEAVDGEKLHQEYTFSFYTEPDWLVRVDVSSIVI